MSDWLDNVGADKTALAEVKQAVDEWRRLMFERDRAEEVAKEASRKYTEYVAVLVQKLRSNGLDGLQLEDGTKVNVVQQVKCSIKGRTEEDKRKNKEELAKWLREQGADDLVKETLTVMPSAIPVLRANNIGYDENIDMNTNSVKAWVKGEMQVNNLTIEDLPNALAWFMWDDIKVSN